MKLKALSICLLAMLLASCGNSQSTSNDNAANTQDQNSTKVVVQDPFFPDDLSDYCSINRHVTDEVLVEKEEGDQYNYTMDIAIEVDKRLEITNKNDIDIRTALLDGDHQQIGIFYITPDSKDKLIDALMTGGKTMLTFRREANDALPLSNAESVEICVAKIGENKIVSDVPSEYQPSDISEADNYEYPETVDMEMEGDI